MLFYSNIYGKRKIERALSLILYEHFGLPERAKLSYRSISIFVRIFVVPTTTRSGFAKYNNQVKTVELHIYDKHHTIFTTQYINSLAFIILMSRFREGDSETYSDRARHDKGWYEKKNIEIEYVAEERDKFIYKTACTHAKEKIKKKKNER